MGSGRAGSRPIECAREQEVSRSQQRRKRGHERSTASKTHKEDRDGRGKLLGRHVEVGRDALYLGGRQILTVYVVAVRSTQPGCQPFLFSTGGARRGPERESKRRRTGCRGSR